MQCVFFLGYPVIACIVWCSLVCFFMFFFFRAVTNTRLLPSPWNLRFNSYLKEAGCTYNRQSKSLGCLCGVPLQIALWNSGGWDNGWCVIITMIANSIGEWFDANLPHSVMEDLHMCRYLSLTFEATAIKFMAALVFLYSMCVTVCITLCVCDCVWMYVCVCV